MSDDTTGSGASGQNSGGSGQQSNSSSSSQNSGGSQGSGSGTGSQSGSGQQQGGGQNGATGSGGNRSHGDDHLDSLLGGGGTSSSSGGSGSSGSGSGQSGTSGQQGGGTDTGLGGNDGPVTLDQVKALIEGMGQSWADRLVGAQGKQQRRGTGQGQQNSQGQNDGQGQQQNQSTTEQNGPSEADVREARMELRNELRDHRPRGASDAERDLGEALGAQFLNQNLADGQAPDRAARAAAKRATEQVKAYGDAVREDTVKALRKRGVLTEGAGQGQGGGSGAAGVQGQRSSISELEQANRERADRANQRAGHDPAKQTA